MKKAKLSAIFSTLLFLILSFTISNCWAYATQTSAASYQKLIEVIKNFYLPNNTLLVLDVDDTLMMMPCSDQRNPTTCQYLGGPAWFDWQTSLPVASPYRVADSFADLLKVNTLLFSLNNMPYTEKDIPVVLHQLATQEGIHLLIETARGPDALSATGNQLRNLAMPNGNLLALIDQHALKPITGFNNPFQPCGDNQARPVSYQQGVFYIAGQPKGQMLHCLLKNTHSRQIKNIVFMDDTPKNVEDVYQSFVNDNRYNVVAIHYTRLNEHKTALTRGEKAKSYQSAAKHRWENIKRAMEHNLIKPPLPDSK